MATITRRGKPVQIAGNLPAKGEKAPPFRRLVTKDLKEVSLADYAGKRKVVSIFPSIDTPTCATSTRKFNAEVASLKDTVVLCISADLPFAARRFCAAEGINDVVTLSLFRSPEFMKDWGVLVLDGEMEGLSTRAVVVLDADDNVLHSQLVPEMTTEPDYDAALSALRA